jgi:hypothetical protein
MSVLERIEHRLAAAALAEEGDVETAREIEAEVEDDEAAARARRRRPHPGRAPPRKAGGR